MVLGSELIGSRFQLKKEERRVEKGVGVGQQIDRKQVRDSRKKSGGRSWCWAANRQEVGSRLKKEERRAEEGGGDRQRIDRKWVRDARKKKQRTKKRIKERNKGK